jgi:hypothetical protein
MSFALSAALEAVKFQIQPILFEAITQNVKKIRAEKDYTPTSAASKELSALIRRTTGLAVTVGYDESSEINAAALLPDLDRNHPIVYHGRKTYLASRDAISLLRKKGTHQVEGGVDLLDGKVTGIYQDVECELILTTGLVDDTGFSHEEVAAVLLHEIGHLMTYFEYIHRTVTTNYALLSVAEEVTQSDPQKRIQLIDATSKHFNYDAADLEGLKDVKSKDVAYSILLTRHIRKTRSELGSNLYDQRGCEHLADQYASRMGAGPSMVTALAKMQRRNPSRYSTSQFVLFEGLKIMLVLLSTLAVSPVVLVLLMVAYDPTDKIYDDPEARMRRIRNELIGGMKNKAIPKSQREKMKKDLEIIDQTLTSFNDRRTFYEFLYSTFLPSTRRQTSQMANQQELEALANNELFSKAMNFTLI